MIRKDQAKAKFKQGSEGLNEGLGDAKPDRRFGSRKSMSKTIGKASSRLESRSAKERYRESLPRRRMEAISLPRPEPRIKPRQSAASSRIQQGDQTDLRTLSRALSRFLCRAALFLWIRFFPDALSSRGNARLEASCAPLTSLLSRARIMRLMLVRIRERKLVLCMRLFSDCRARFLAWELLATGSSLLRIGNSMRQYRSGEDICKYPKNGICKVDRVLCTRWGVPCQCNSIFEMSNPPRFSTLSTSRSIPRFFDSSVHGEPIPS